MRVVYAGAGSGTSLSRLNALRTLEADVHFFDVTARRGATSRLARLADNTLFYTPGLRRLNREFLAFCRAHSPDVVWVDKSVWIWPSTLRSLRRDGCFLAHHFTDAIDARLARLRWSFHLLRKSLPLYHLNFTTNVDDCTALRRAGVPVELTHLAYDHERFDDSPLPAADAAAWRAPIVFIGHHEPRTERYVQALLAAGLPVVVYGWAGRAPAIARRWPDAVSRPGLSDVDYVKAIKGADIGLCCVSEWNYNQTAARSYEIPACGTFLLAMRTPQHLESYREGSEAEFFETPDELVSKARFYLEHDDRRRAIAAAGHRRCVTDEYTWARYMRQDWARARNAWAARRVDPRHG